MPVFGEEIPKYNEPYSPIFTDKEVYSWTEKVNIMIVAPSWNAERSGIDTIGDDPDHSITISTREFELENYKLTETNPNSGVFVGEVILTGFEHDADGDGDVDTNPRTFGSGPTNGFLQTDRDGGITISFEFADGVILTHSALVSWNIGSVMFFDSQYKENQTPVVRVVDLDMNLNPEGIDQLPLKISSDSDSAGITVEANEINENSGLFEARITLSQNSASGGNRLFALPGDTIIAKYEDNTLPPPYSRNDEIEITSTAEINSATPTLERISMGELIISDDFGNPVEGFQAYDRLQISAGISNEQIYGQDFVILFQIKDEDGKITSLSWVQGKLEKLQNLNLAQSWIPQKEGNYVIETFVWDSLKSPIPLSASSSKSFTVG